MASPFQKQAFRRKLIYLGAILVLFTAAFLWRNGPVQAQAANLAVREVDRGEVKLTDAVLRLSLTGLRGVTTCGLWWYALEKQKKNQWNELELVVRSVAKLQPHFITPWLFQSWNLTYNVSVEADRVRDKYFYMTRGIELLAEGEKQNRDNPDLRFWIGFYIQHKICKSDETNVIRSLFQLSLMPPNERDPERFRIINPGGGEEINLVEFEKFCQKNPQLIRRLREGMIRDTKGEGERQFTCSSVRDVIAFLSDNWKVPSPYEDSAGAAAGNWQPGKADALRPLADRFPPLPPARDPQPPQRIFDRRELTSDQHGQLGDSINGHMVARTWFAYAQEPIPDADELPGSTKPILDRDRAVQRVPKKPATLIFRNHPALAQSYVAEHLQQEGWFDNDLYELTGWFPKNQFSDGSRARVGDDKVKWSQEAWADAHERWRRYGEENHLLFESPAKEANFKQLAMEFMKRYKIDPRQARMARPESFTEPGDKERFFASQYMWEYEYNRNQLSNFPPHFSRSLVEAKDETVTCRKKFYQAERLRWAGSYVRSIALYAQTLPEWRDKVLLKNKDFRLDQLIQEDSYDWQYRYLRLNHLENGQILRQRMTKLAQLVPLVPPMSMETFPAYLQVGPLDGVVDEDGTPLINQMARDAINSRRPPVPGANRQGPKREAPPSAQP